MRGMWQKSRWIVMLVVLAGAVNFVACGGQNARLSPMASVSQTIGENTEVSIVYSRPAVKGRQIWGDLVAYDKVWRTGANEATTIEFSEDVTVQGAALAAGKYALFTIPGEGEWTFIFNTEADQWGAYDYDNSKDALTVKATPQKGGSTEWMQFSFEDPVGTSTRAVLAWKDVQVALEIAAADTSGDIRKSLKGTVMQRLGDSTDVQVVYSRPGVKGRTVWGELVPMDKVWRTGANENTVFSSSGDISVNGQPLAAGNYGLHTIPGASEWTVIFSKKADLWGSGGYDPVNDALRIKVAPQATSSPAEWMTFAAEELTPGGNGAVQEMVLTLSWDNLQLPIRISAK